MTNNDSISTVEGRGRSREALVERDDLNLPKTSRVKHLFLNISERSETNKMGSRWVFWKGFPGTGEGLGSLGAGPRVMTCTLAPPHDSGRVAGCHDRSVRETVKGGEGLQYGEERSKGHVEDVE